MAYGSPATEEDIAAYFTHIRGGRAPSPEALAFFAGRLNVTPGTVQRWVRTGRVRPTLVTPGNQFRFDLDDVLEQLGQPRKRPD